MRWSFMPVIHNRNIRAGPFHSIPIYPPPRLPLFHSGSTIFAGAFHGFVNVATPLWRYHRGVFSMPGDIDP
jgi:hypothetical protein